jgi:hypothetical protein
MVSTAAGGRLGASDARDGSGTGAAERRRAPPARRAASVLTSTGPSCSTGGATETYGTGKGRARTVSTAAGVRIGASDAWQCNGYALACRKTQAPPIAAGATARHPCSHLDGTELKYWRGARNLRDGKGRARTVSTAAGVRIGASDA